ncbi:MAG: hypothetical protein ICV81_16990 [Flavisolibacter sp.]|nr:hypothetical protein [Flavisolibacter sp.]
MIDQSKQARKFLSQLGLLLLMNFYSCGFAYEKQVTGKYYIIGVETKEDLILSYALGSGDYIGKAPGKIVQYGFNDTFLVAKTQEYKNGSPSYYIIDMTKDSELAHEEKFRIGPLSEEEYSHTWKQRLNIQLKDVK